MAANDFDYASVPLVTDLSVKNTSVTDIAAGNVVTFDSATTATAPSINVKRATTDDYPVGVAMEAIPAGKSGRVRPIGVAQCVASAAITAGAIVEASTVGKVVTAGAGKPQLGQCLTTAGADLDKVLVLLAIAKNA